MRLIKGKEKIMMTFGEKIRPCKEKKMAEQ